ncbi:MAG: hypothetical protein Kow0031_29970 [Anaerolineae bacterium]
MAKKSLGYVELEWHCPNCSTRNPGSRKTCSSCGMPQPEDIQFEQQAQEKIITDEAKLAQAQAGPDIHCYYCGSRNPGNAESCSQCGANLKEGTRRDSGDVLGAHRDKAAPPVTCPACGSENEASAPKCATCGAALVQQPPPPPPPPPPSAKKSSSAAKGGIFGGAGLLAILLGLCVVCAVGYFMLAGQTEELLATAKEARWERTIQVEGLVPVSHEAWHDEIPRDGDVVSCSSRVRRTQDNPAANAKEVCGTPYTVDSGSGFGEVVQDCKYEISEDFCEYTLPEWQVVDEVTRTGSNSQPQWPALNLPHNQREGEREERYRCVLSTESGDYVYGSSNPDLLTRCTVGSRWRIEVNTFNAVTEMTPAQ